MLLTIHSPGGESESGAVDAEGLTLGRIFRDADQVSACRVNGQFRDDWRGVVAGRGDRVEIYGNVGTVAFFIVLIIQLALSAIVQALTPKPKKPKFGKRDDGTGIAGFANVTGPGTPKFLVLGERDVAGAPISSKIEVASDGKSMKASVLYFMGDTGGNGYESIDQVRLNDSNIDNFKGTTYEVRLGTDTQAFIDAFDAVSTVFSDPRQIGETDIVYTTKGNTVQRLKIAFQFTSLFRATSTGGTGQGRCKIKIEKKKTSEAVGAYAEISGSPFLIKGRTQSQLFHAIDTDLPSADQWDIRITRTELVSTGSDPFLYNVQESQLTTLNYGGCALLGVKDIDSAQIQSLDSLRTVARVKGLRVDVWNGSSFTRQWTAERAWILREMLVNDRIGMGDDYDPAEIHNESFLDVQNYWNETVTGQNGPEVRDHCDMLMSARQRDHDVVNKILVEGRARIMPSGDKQKLVVDRPGTAGLAYTEGFNVIEHSVEAENSLPDRPINLLYGEFPNVDNDYKTDVVENPPRDDVVGTIVDDAVQFETVTRASEVYRYLMHDLKERTLVKRRWRWKAPKRALPSEAWDLATVQYKTQENKRGFGGYAAPESTVSKLVCDKLVTIEAGSTYQIALLHRKDNTVETRTVANPAGEYFEIMPTVDFSFPPYTPPGLDTPPDAATWSIGKQNIQIPTVRIQDLTMEDDGTIEILATEYVPAVYTPDPMPPKDVRRFFGFHDLPPLPIRDAQVREEIALNKDGNWESIIHFDVTPGLQVTAGLAQAGGAAAITFQTTEPAHDDYFNGAIVRIVSGPGVGEEKKISDYSGVTKVATVASAWTVQPTSSSRYEVRFERFGVYHGFEVWVSDDLAGPYNFLWSFLGTHGELSGRAQGGTQYFQFYPVTAVGARRTLSGPIVSITTQGDGGRPGDVVNFSCMQIGDHLMFTLSRVADTDKLRYEIREGPSWDAGGVIPLAAEMGSNGFSSPVLTTGIHTFWCKAFDRSDNESLNAASVTIDVQAPVVRKELLRIDELVQVTGSFAGTALRDIAGARYLSLASSNLWDSGSLWDTPGRVWDTPTLLAGSYTTGPLDLSRNGIARAFLDLAFAQMAGASYSIEVSTSQDGSVFGAFRPLTTGDLRMKSVKIRLNLFADTPAAEPLVSKIHAVVDAQKRAIHFNHINLPPGGRTIDFDPPFFEPPAIAATAYSDEKVNIVAKSQDAVTLRLGAGVDGFADVTVGGV